MRSGGTTKIHCLDRSIYARAPRRCIALLALFLVFTFSLPALAVIPSAIGPMQALIAILPQILAAMGVVLGAAAVAVLKPSTYKSLFRYCWSHKSLTTGMCGCMALVVWGGSKVLSKKVEKEEVGAPWTAFRGGPERSGSVPGAQGPLKNPMRVWNFMPTGTGIVSVDSSPAVVGNRVYFSVSGQSPLGSKSGAIYCLDKDTGGQVWRYGGEDLDRPLDPIFSSPAVGGGPLGNEARYLVCGEGYHVEENSRLICLDLEPVRASGGKEGPKAKWTIESTNHVESSPCIFEGKVYVGTGDDGYWCVELETGHVKFHLESDAEYVISEGTQVEALSKLAGKTVMARGLPRRWRPEKGKDESVMFLDVREFKEVPEGTTLHPEPPKLGATARVEPLRYVIGKLVVADSPIHKAEGGSKLKIEIPVHYPDAESPPIATRINGEPRLIFGNGVNGQAVACVDAETGKPLWKTKLAFPSFGPPTIAGDKILTSVSNATFIASDANPAGSILCLSATDGQQQWEYKTSDGVLGAVAVKDGLAYACSCDNNVYVLNVKDGTLVKKFNTGGAMVCSPAITDKGVFFSTKLGKLFCLKRESADFQWSLNLTPGEMILSSPAIAGNKLYVGSYKKGVFCIGENPNGAEAERAQPWSGLGGTTGRASTADSKGPPSVKGNKSDLISDESKIKSRAASGPIAACGKLLYFPAQAEKPLLSCVDVSEKKEMWGNVVPGTVKALAADENLVYVWCDSAKSTLVALRAGKGDQIWEKSFERTEQPTLILAGNRLIVRDGEKTIAGLSNSTGAPLWKKDIEGIVGVPAAAHGLVFITTSNGQATNGTLICLDDSNGTKIWQADLGAKPLGGPTVSGDKIFVSLPSKEAEGAKILCRKLVDGSAIWAADIEKAPASYLVASSDYVAFSTADGTVLVLNTEKGEQTHTVLLGKGGQAPALVQNLLLLGADNRVGAYDLSSSNWVWGFREQNKIGKVWAAPILVGESVWLSTEKMGLIAVGAKE